MSSALKPLAHPSENINTQLAIGVLNHDDEVFNRFVNQSLHELSDETEVIIKSGLPPAAAYNQILDECSAQHVLFCHADVLFDQAFIDAAKKATSQIPDYGALGVVGVKKPLFRKREYCFARDDQTPSVTTLDSCCILINKGNNLRFDEVTFDEYHHFVEDYCMQVKYVLKRKTHLIASNFSCKTAPSLDTPMNNYFYHADNTVSTEGGRWGNWGRYKKALDAKWGRKVLTT